jgi:phospholipase/lecithinase/hemolysin
MPALSKRPLPRIWTCSQLVLIALILTFSAAVAVTPSPAQDRDQDRDNGPHHRRIDLSRLIVVGDSLSAGFQNDSLLDTQQPHGYASLVAAQANVSLLLPLIAPPGIPNVLELVSPGPPPIFTSAPGTSPGRDNPTIQVTDLAVPGANLNDVLNTRPNLPITPSNILTDLILGEPGAALGVIRSQLEWAKALNPTTIFVWAGNEDALAAALAADPALLTPIPKFRVAYAELLNRLSATGATLVVANIPDVTIVPCLTPSEDVAEELGLPLFVIEPILGISSGDYVTPDAIPLILARLANPSLGPLPPNVVLRAANATKIRVFVDAYNAIIEDQAKQAGATLVDIHQLANRIRTRGIAANGQILTNEFLGGIFSLDGVHPTNTGYGVIANAFIDALNRGFDANIPYVSIDHLANTDPLVFPGIEPPDSIQRHVDPGTAKSLRDWFVK